MKALILVFMLVVVFGFGVGSVSAQLSDAPWPMFQHDAQHTGRSQFAGPIIPNHTHYQLPCISFTTDRTSPIIGPSNTIYLGRTCLNLSKPRTDPFYESAFLYVLNPNGTLKWKYELGLGGMVLSTPAISQGNIIYVRSEIYNESLSKYFSYLNALYPNGTLKWKYNIGESFNVGYGYSNQIQSSPVISPDGTIYIGSGLGLMALHPNGRLKWTRTLCSNVDSSPVVDLDGTVYILNCYALYSYYPDGIMKFVKRILPLGGGSEHQSPSIDETLSVIYFIMTSNKTPRRRELFAIYLNGTTKWSYPLTEHNSSFYRSSYQYKSPSIDNEHIVYVTIQENCDDNLNYCQSFLYSFYPNGTLRWLFNETARLNTISPIIDKNNMVYVLLKFGLYSFYPNGSIRWNNVNVEGSQFVIDSEGKIYTHGPSILSIVDHSFQPQPSCTDNIQNQDETDIDCGGSECQKCEDGKNCLQKADCLSNYCNPNKICSVPNCNDGWKNGDETGIDCGGSCPSCPPPPPSCFDGIQNGIEEGVDCGGNCLDECEYKLKLLFIPISWDGTYEEFKEASNEIGNFFVNITSIKDCKEQAKIIISGKENYGLFWDDWKCRANAGGFTGGATRTLFYTTECAREFKKRTNIDYDYIIGLADYDICSLAHGCSISGLSNPLANAIISEAYIPPLFILLDATTTAHELGHKFGLKDQYCDCNFAWNPLVVNKCGPHVSPNPLKLELGCDFTDSGDCCWDETPGPYSGCNRWCKGNFAMNSETRTVMSDDIFSSGFSIDEFNYLKSKGLECSSLSMASMNMITLESGENVADIILEIMIEITNNNSIMNTSISVVSGIPLNSLIQQTTGNYSLTILDDDNYILYNSSFELEFFVSGIPELLNETIIYDKIPYNTSMREIQVYHNNDLIFQQNINFCNFDYRCDSDENYFSCPNDCEPWQNDGVCNNEYDGICDPDCAEGIDPDCTLNATIKILPSSKNKTYEANVTLEFKNLETGNLTLINLTTNSSGEAEINILPGLYSMTAKPRYYLRNGIYNIIILPSYSIIDFGIAKNGDFNNDNKVNFLDVGGLSGSYGSECGQDAYKWYVDYNNDCKIDFYDLPSFSGSYGLVGEPSLKP